MLCDTIEIDDDLFAAQDSRLLAVFVGAGVSMGPPSNLPSFSRLVDRIGEGVPDFVAGQGLPFDVQLGRLQAQGVDVHERCRRIITNPTSLPTALHAAILRLFPNPDDIRIVTSNFDKHFSRSAAALGITIPTFSAPALPLGGDFHGLVHLHGWIDDPARMILTEGDFGAAYMTDGYVARFLRDLFATYTVLFIGYSHADPPMNYFNQGLGVRRRRHFILTHEDAPAQWRRLRLVPQVYLASGSDHTKLELAVTEWAHQTALRPADVAARLQQILATPDILAPSQEGFLLRHYSREHSVGAFIEHAQLFDWVRWMHAKALIRPILHESNPGTPNGQLSHWLGKELAKDSSGFGLAMVEEYGGVLNAATAHGVLVDLLRAIETAPPTLAQKQWLELLLRQSRATYIAIYANVVSALRRWNEWDIALQIIAYLVSPTIRFPSDNRPNPHFAGTGPFPSLLAEHYDLTQAFDAIAVFAGKDTSRRVALLGVLEQACQALSGQCSILGLNNHHRGGLVSIDSILTSDRYDADPIGALIAFTCRFARDLASEGKLDKETYVRWMDSKNQILIRCALLCMEKSQLTPSEILDVLIHHNGFYPLAFFAATERAPLIHSIYPELTTEERAAFWEAQRRGPTPEWQEGAPHE